MHLKQPPFTKTGTTIIGLICKDAVILAADTRATAGPTVADKNCEKLHKLAPNIYAAGAGTAADLQFVTHRLNAELELFRLNAGREIRIN
jgi:20S proteasome subunit beta 2